MSPNAWIILSRHACVHLHLRICITFILSVLSVGLCSTTCLRQRQSHCINFIETNVHAPRTISVWVGTCSNNWAMKLLSPQFTHSCAEVDKEYVLKTIENRKPTAALMMLACHWWCGRTYHGKRHGFFDTTIKQHLITCKTCRHIKFVINYNIYFFKNTVWQPWGCVCVKLSMIL